MILSVLLFGVEGGPVLTEEVSLFQLFGYIGLFLGVVLILRVAMAALRDTEEPS